MSRGVCPLRISGVQEALLLREAAWVSRTPSDARGDQPALPCNHSGVSVALVYYKLYIRGSYVLFIIHRGVGVQCFM